ncbi:MAG TPA: DUF1292 domain-containing protein [Candidatus Merdibacter merdavium]|uniref:UPF0473 protein H9702_05410 n=1 Tax=Candidatus Merdibacter merdavium TaxID=2838692 RepID=A0A9D2NQ86_9FIRM|nr:DUF1292 domain-containing protein [Candidatus Merdibacter merdavium]
MLDSNSLYVVDEDGSEKRMTILFTFENEQYGRQYVVFEDPQDDSGQVFASAFDDEGSLLPLESEEEWAMVEEVIGAFAEDEDEAQE